jgi:hypothetical protein
VREETAGQSRNLSYLVGFPAAGIKVNSELRTQKTRSPGRHKATGRQNNWGKIMKENRIGERRFSFHSAQSFPFQDASGKINLDDRRRTADRRLNNIWLELVTLKPSDILFGWHYKM